MSYPSFKRAIHRTRLYDCEQVVGLFTNSENHKQIDLRLDSTVLEPSAISLDTTVSCTLLPSYITTTASDAMAALANLAHLKYLKHGNDVASQHRTLLTFASDTLGGIGPPEFADWLQLLFAEAERRANPTNHRRENFHYLDQLLCALLYTLIRDNVYMINKLTILDQA